MKVHEDIVLDMFDVIHDSITGTGAPKYIEFFDSDEETLCMIPFGDVVQDSSILSDFYFQDQFGSRIIRKSVIREGLVTKFKIYDNAPKTVLSGDVTLPNNGGDVTINALNWEIGQIVILSSLKIYFPAEG